MKIPTYKNVTVGPSKIEGVGIIALKDFEKGETLFPLEGTIIKVKDTRELDHDVLDHAVPIDIVNGNYVLVGQPSLSNYFNHSCSPNAGFRDDKEFVAIRDIKKGEELVIDYAFCDIDGFTMACHCGSSNCRKEVVPFEKLDSTTQKKYLPYVINYIRKKYLASHNQEA
ncbi:MAG TPA: SET domain-containing protein-lysine N-methyltransferase [Candidatus Acidoferrales bacterium]|nr:SET domain-containing protein-lysine N-methyltransferase [Candidatus Acidoferrales bacterium]